ncbi:MAG: DUF1295 domain-containing protein [Myxococcales bacterium]|nr:DUF1295 domain-containing protein [Myxococcales bacterium]
MQMKDTNAPHRAERPPMHFGGPAGTLLLMLALPALVYYLWISVHYHGGALVVPRSLEDVRRLVGLIPLPTPRAVFMVGTWLLLQGLLQVLAPGPVVYGTPLRDGSRLPYRMNGWFAFWFTLGLAALAVWMGWVPATALHEEFGPLLSTANLFCFVFSLFLYFYGRATAPTDPRTGHPVYDYFMGTALNPRLGRFDFKFFFESRPGLIAWVLIDLSLAAAQLERHGTISTPMLLVCAFQILYVADYFFHEPAILTTLDIRHEHFGFMLCWGSAVWVPFTYCLQAYYLVTHPHELPLWATMGIVMLNLVGYYIFRSANLQKHRFRTDPQARIWGRPPEFLETARGTRLLLSGWWGLARHANYLGDLIMALAWCLPCGGGHLLPYFYVIYFAVLLIARERRDHRMCQARYGADWDAYCARVRWRIVPWIY